MMHIHYSYDTFWSQLKLIPGNLSNENWTGSKSADVLSVKTIEAQTDNKLLCLW